MTVSRQSIDKRSEESGSEVELNERGGFVIHGVVKLIFGASHSLSDAVSLHFIPSYVCPDKISVCFSPCLWLLFSVLPRPWPGAALSSPPVSKFSRRDNRGSRYSVELQSRRRSPVDGEWRSWFESTRHVYTKTEWKHIISAFFSSSEIGISCCKCLLSRHIFAIYANINETSCNIFYRSLLFSENRIQKVYAFRYRKKSVMLILENHRKRQQQSAWKTIFYRLVCWEAFSDIFIITTVWLSDERGLSVLKKVLFNWGIKSPEKVSALRLSVLSPDNRQNTLNTSKNTHVSMTTRETAHAVWDQVINQSCDDKAELIVADSRMTLQHKS